MTHVPADVPEVQQMQSLQPATPIEQVSDLSNEEVQSAHIDVGPMPRAIELAPWDVSPGTQTAPAEVLHRRSPYNLRRTVRTEGLRARIREQLRPTVYAFDKHYLALAKIKKTNPKLQYPPTNVKLLYSSISPISLGITLAQFGSILRLCQSCDRYLFVERCRTLEGSLEENPGLGGEAGEAGLGMRNRSMMV
ncbi:hypothetical protein DFP72DRAFT_1135694 [Ephemerocybe angulata]|uniref:Uncharacterized protein n=1 Tax=Ephemerocybe angulata TaxID=980116 RepID=A0A8H6LU10_9AGAR|nr:hypothetical protein DFP72DRAFT_1135694 [Tulosesus angulatus]